MKPERAETIRERLVDVGITEISYFEHRFYSPKGETVWWRGALPMTQHYMHGVRLEVFVKESQLDEALRVLAHFVDNKEIKGYISTVEELELQELATV